MRELAVVSKNGRSKYIGLPKYVCDVLGLEVGDQVLINIHKVVSADDEEPTRPDTGGPVWKTQEMLEWMEQGNTVLICSRDPHDRVPHCFKVVEEFIPPKYGGKDMPDEEEE